MSVIVLAFTTLDGIVEDPDGAAGTPRGGWMFSHGREVVAGDKFRLGRTLDEGVLLLGRRTWQHFAQLWPNRDDEFAARMNAAAKLVASGTLDDADVTTWNNSRLLHGDLVEVVKQERRDVIVAGSLGVVERLAAADLVDEYRLVTFPVLLGAGRRLFPAEGPQRELECLQAEADGPIVRSRFRRRAEAFA
ncbi:dihydrofolate reductase family protein [Streptacidiphilus rugosus]|uniref:dihydrofolate reductase family protein n=1 Tax=Streptacidiphilus rugosus TaxID=405783 RepID=UPI00056D42AE|nr:dihydrofolate reductase family protein [Streptacidiphilus rugosus]